MKRPELIAAVEALAREAEAVDAPAAIVLFTLASDLQFYGANALAKICARHAQENINRIHQLRRNQ